MKPHKWAKEIHAWADGAEIEIRNSNIKMCWTSCECPTFDVDGGWKYRIKQAQPKEPQYLYVYGYCEHDSVHITKEPIPTHKYSLGKIKLEQDDD